MSVPATRNVHETIESVIARGDLGALDTEQRNQYYAKVCQSLGLNPMTQPFAYIVLQGRTILYAKRDAADQLRRLHGVSVTDLTETERDGVFIVTAKVQNKEGRTDVAKGAVNITGLKGENLANALMKAETKAKRRATLSICGLGFLDETEVDEITEKMTKPPAIPNYTRADSARKANEAKLAKFTDEIERILDVQELHAWGSEHAVEISGMPDDLQAALRLKFGETLSVLKDLGANGSELAEEDEEVETEQEAQPSISERAIAARDAAHPLDIPANLRRT